MGLIILRREVVLTNTVEKTLPAILRALLATDSMVTLCLEAYFQEKMAVEMLDQEELQARDAERLIGIELGDPMIRRVAYIKGEQSGNKYLLAESLINVKNITGTVKGDILAGCDGIGKVLRRECTETFREIIDLYINNSLIDTPEKLPAGRVVTRKYRIFIGGKPSIFVTEHYPEVLYTKRVV